MTNNEDSAFVLYVDHKGHPAPLSVSYHATASRRLASSIDRHPPSTVTEVDSAYCPQCLSFHDANTASTLGYCQKESCRLCPLCQSVASIAVDGTVCYYQCGQCSWNSKSCLLQTTVTRDDDDQSISLEEVERASKELASQWKIRIEQRNNASEEHYKTMLQTLTGMAKDQVKGLRSSTRHYFPSSMPTIKRSLDGSEGWSIQSLEESIHAREKLLSSTLDRPIGGQELQTISLEVEQPISPSLQDVSAESILLQHNGGSSIETMEDLLPLAIPLRPRKSRRCRAELAEGRPGILVKPKLNPLEGDSSLRTGHGQWWKKDSSAIEVLPRVRVSIHASDGSRHAFLLKITNPTLGIIRLRLAGSSYAGEYVWNDSSVSSPSLENLLLDPLSEASVDAHLDSSIISDELQPSDICELEPAEDSFLELGKTSDDVPDAVTNWNAADVLFESKVSKELQAAVCLVGLKKSVAWFELVILEPSSMKENMHCAIPLALQIQVGDGSWESSLIQSQQGEDKDLVSFDLVIIWDNID